MAGEFRSLPIEVLDRIFQHLSQRSLKECQRVCQLWYPHATRHFMHHIIFRNSDEIERFLDCQPRMTSAVKRLEIERDIDSDDVPKENIQKLMMSVTNLQELVLNDDLLPLYQLNDIDLPTSLTSITTSRYLFDTTSDVYKFIEILTKLRDTIQKFNMVIDYTHDEFFDNWNMIEFFTSFPKLLEFDMREIDSIKCFADCLPVILAIPSLKSFIYYSDRDIDSELTNTTQFKQRLGKLEKLDFTLRTILPHTISFIIQNFVGLKEIDAGISYANIVVGSSDSIILLDFMDFIYPMDMFKFSFKTVYDFYLKYLSNMISKTFTQLPENSQNLSKQLHVDVQYHYHLFAGDEIEFWFRLESNRDYCNRLQRKINWALQYDKNLRNELFKCIASLDKINVDIFVFNMSNTPSISRGLDMFFEFLSLLIDPKRVILNVSNGSKWSKFYKKSNQIDHITQLEIQVIIGEDLECNGLSLYLDTFSNLKTLRLAYFLTENSDPYDSDYILEFPLLNLETFYLDVTLLITYAKDLIDNCFFLEIETNNAVHSYIVSTITLNATKIPKEMSKFYSIYSQITIKIHTIQNLYLQVLGITTGLNPTNAYQSLSPFYLIKETLISL